MIRRFINAFMRAFFHLLYHGLAFTYDLVADVVSLGHWRDWVYSILPILDGELLLELGHGPGHLQGRLLANGMTAFGLDESRQMSRQARRRLRGLPFRLVRGDARALPFPSASFPTLVATFPSEYIFAPETLAETHRVLREGGRMVILLAAWPGGSSLPEKAFRLLFRLTGESPSENPDFSILERRFSEHGFSAEFRVEHFHSTRLLTICLTKIAQNPAI